MLIERNTIAAGENFVRDEQLALAELPEIRLISQGPEQICDRAQSDLPDCVHVLERLVHHCRLVLFAESRNGKEHDRHDKP